MRLLILLSAIVLSIAIERSARFRFRDARFFRDYFTTDVVYLFSAVLLALGLANTFLAPLTAWFESAVVYPRLFDLDLPLWALVLLAVAAVDLGEFLTHYLLHRSDTLWEIHKIHHSSIVVDWLATFRSHFLEQILRNAVPPAALLLVGFPLDATLLAYGIYSAFAVFNHSNTRIPLGPLETLFITPRLHQMHHSSDKTSQMNFGTVFSVWDRMMGTLATVPDPGMRYGVPGEVNSYPQHWSKQHFEPFRRWLAAVHARMTNARGARSPR